MAFVLADRVKETTTTTGTGTVTLAGAVSGFQTFSAGVGNGNSTAYCITSGTAWEVGIGTYTSSGTTLSRTTILASSNSGSAITLSGTSTVFCTDPAGIKPTERVWNFGTSTSGTYQAITAFDAGWTIPIAEGDTFRFRISMRKAGNATQNLLFTLGSDTAKGYRWCFQNDGNVVLYKAVPSSSSVGATGVILSHDSATYTMAVIGTVTFSGTAVNQFGLLSECATASFSPFYGDSGVNFVGDNLKIQVDSTSQLQRLELHKVN